MIVMPIFIYSNYNSFFLNRREPIKFVIPINNIITQIVKPIFVPAYTFAPNNIFKKLSAIA